MSKLTDKSMKELVSYHNELRELISEWATPCRKEAKTKTFSNKAKAIAAIKTLQEQYNKTYEAEQARIDLAAKTDKKTRVKKVKKADKKTVVKKTTAKSDGKIPRGAVKQLCESLLMVSDSDGEGLSYDEIIRQVQQKYPSAKTSKNCLRWYANKMRVAGESVPYRPRSVANNPMSGYRLSESATGFDDDVKGYFMSEIVCPNGDRISVIRADHKSREKFDGNRSTIASFRTHALAWSNTFSEHQQSASEAVEAWVNYELSKMVDDAKYGPKGFFQQWHRGK